ncbi:hypothetical protein TYRP_007718 [Tyrophagus putrescentiae]|nr:hypothetical protein TYRP_007718 [Tyrophagus putrescentiae]
MVSIGVRGNLLRSQVHCPNSFSALSSSAFASSKLPFSISIRPSSIVDIGRMDCSSSMHNLMALHRLGVLLPQSQQNGLVEDGHQSTE